MENSFGQEFGTSKVRIAVANIKLNCQNFYNQPIWMDGINLFQQISSLKGTAAVVGAAIPDGDDEKDEKKKDD